MKKKLPDKKCFHRFLKDGITDDIGEKIIWSHNWWRMFNIKIWNEFNLKNIRDYHDHYLKKDVL